MKFEENTVGALSLLFIDKLADKYPEREVHQLIYMVFEFFINYDKTDLILKADEEIQSDMIREMKIVVERLSVFEPIQQILGYSWFSGTKFEINKDVLIPRQETEELVEWIIKDNTKTNPKILDIGTGSGCIAIALNKAIPSAKITGVDVSADALLIAGKNSKSQGISMNLINANVLETDWFLPYKDQLVLFDIIVSNPPYITENESELMKPNVLNFEPKKALFVNNETPIIFYIAIVDFARKHLHENGKLYFEINESYGKEVINLLEKNNFENILLKKDLNDKDRMVSCVMPRH